MRRAFQSTAHQLIGRLAMLASLRAASTLDVEAVKASLLTRNVFDPAVINSTIGHYKEHANVESYIKSFTVEEIADHVYGLLCATAREKLGDSFSHVHESELSAFYFAQSERQAEIDVLRRIERYLSDRAALTKTHAVSLRSYDALHQGTVMYSVKLIPFHNANPAAGEVSLTELASGAFLGLRSAPVQKRYEELIAKVNTSTTPVYSVTEENGLTVLSMAISADRTSYLRSLVAIINEIPGAKVEKKFMETFSNGTHVYTFYIRGPTVAQVEERTTLVGLLPHRQGDRINRLHEEQVLNIEQAVYAHCLVNFAFYFTPKPAPDDYVHIRSILSKEPNGVNRLNNLRSTLSQEMMSEHYMSTLIEEYPQFVKEIYQDFIDGTTAERRASILSKIKTQLNEDQRLAHDIEIFTTFLRFNQSVLKHNFLKVDKAAVAFRLDPEVMMQGLEFPRTPYGIFLFASGQWRGFHVRFTDIARGGVRMIISKPNMYRKNKATVFQENFNLAHTQLLKNKDIPEGGSKGTILVSPGYLTKFEEGKAKQLFLQYVDALLDVTLNGEAGVVDNYKKEEIIFLGPDENTAGSFPSAGAMHSKNRGFKSWKSFTTGKDPILGGIPHDVYGMTTRSVRRMVEGIYGKLNLDQTKLRKFQTGGPDGDLGSNEILRSKEKVVGMVDISASVHDPDGINRDELARLAKGRKQLKEFDRSTLSPKGFLVLTDEKNVKLPDGTLVENGATFRDTFHFAKYSDADVFVPCGGRPRSVSLDDVHKFLRVKDATGEAMLAGKYDGLSQEDLKFKIIVEGANLFISQDARLALERCGVILIKDASANKGGVTSSSLEVYTGLALSDEEHGKLMSAQDEHSAPQFYKDMVQEICNRVEANATREFEAIWQESQANPGMPKTLIADGLSSKIVSIRANMLKSNLFEDKKLLRLVLEEYTPKTLKAVVPIDVLMKRVPEPYQHAICAMWIASNYVYKTGLTGNEFDFFQYMRSYSERAAAL